MRLLKEFSPKHFEPKSRAREYDEFDTEQPTKMARRGQITDQLVELPIEHQIYDMIDAEGTRGLKITEVCKILHLTLIYQSLSMKCTSVTIYIQCLSCGMNFQCPLLIFLNICNVATGFQKAWNKQ